MQQEQEKEDRTVLLAALEEKTEVIRAVLIGLRKNIDGLRQGKGNEGDRALVAEKANNIKDMIAFQEKRLEGFCLAIGRVKLGKDYCDECQDPIPMLRLMANPAATLCIDCQREKEKRAKYCSGSCKIGLVVA